MRPGDGVPEPIADSRALAAAAEALAGGAGPIAVDAERASGYRYGQRAYLVQLRRAGAGSFLIDPIPCPDLGTVNDALRGVEWVLHAASQDLPCLDELGMRPDLLFDTELAGRLLGLPRVGLGPMVQSLLGVRLEKGHSAADWSKRPLPESWLAYAALDVELLIALRDELAGRLDLAGKLGWAEQEFAAIVDAPPPAPRADPWRRTSGIQRVHQRRRLATVRELWELRDELAAARDIAPGRILLDAAIIAASSGDPAGAEDLRSLPGFRGPANRRIAGRWWAAIVRARAMDDAALPPVAAGGDGPPPASRWASRDPAAAERLTASRRAVGAIAAERGLPVENLLAPDAVRRLAWEPPAPVDLASVTRFLIGRQARPWQVALTAEALTGALTARAPAPVGSPPDTNTSE